jgi:hypothetical protein
LTDELHKVHAGHDVKTKSVRVDIGSVAWRGEGGSDRERKAAMALRLAVCWNICEGIPTARLLDGVVLDYYVAVDKLLAALGEQQLFHDAAKVAELARCATAVKQAQEAIGVEHFRCQACERAA